MKIPFSIIIVKFGKPEIAKKSFMLQKKPITIWDVNVTNIVLPQN